MLPELFDVAIIGNGAIATALKDTMGGRRVAIISRSARGLSNDAYTKFFAWDGNDPDASVKNKVRAKTVIYAVLPVSRRVAREAISLGHSILAPDGLYVHLSTIAIKTKPSNKNAAPFGFAGDGYIRLKRYEIKVVNRLLPEALVLYPGVVDGPGSGWGRFFNRLEYTDLVDVGTDVDKPAPIISLANLAHQISDSIEKHSHGKDFPVLLPDPRDSNLPTWRDLFERYNVKIEKKSYNYFPSLVKDWAVKFAVSPFVPFWVWEWIGARREEVGVSRVSQQTVVGRRLSITAMTSHYIGCDYVL